jgi:hypothetical protein
MLEKAPAYPSLSAEEKKRFARSLVDVLSFISDPYAGLAARGLEDANQANAALKSRLSQKQDFAGKDFKAGASTQGARVFRDLVTTVDFPKFVSGLVEGVYTSIVSSSIRQMREYGKLLEQVAKSVDQFAKENISPDEARQFVQNSFPGQIDLGDDGKLMLSESDTSDKEQAPPDFKTALQIPENIELTEENEEKIVLAAQMKMARQRQQTLAQMMAMGINRVIVTDGEIKANVLFDMKARDTAQRQTQAAVSDVVTQTSSSGGGGWFSDDWSNVSTQVSSAYSAEQDKSDSSLEVKAKLSGSVTVKFKSETFPLERLASADERGAIQQKSTR